jgi:hypothetical protein
VRVTREPFTSGGHTGFPESSNTVSHTFPVCKEPLLKNVLELRSSRECVYERAAGEQILGHGCSEFKDWSSGGDDPT